MPDKIEQILRAIHILFSKGEMYHEFPDKVVLSKREMYDLLEQLNYAVVEVMDQYEATTRSKEKAKQQLEQEGQRIVDAAGKEAEDVYAASMLYTDGALNELYAIVDDTKLNLRAEYSRFEETMNEQMEQIQNNQRELLDQLRALSQGQKYLDLIDEYNEAHMPVPESDEEWDEEESDAAESEQAAEEQRGANHKSAKQQETAGNQPQEAKKKPLPDAVIPEKFQLVRDSGGKLVSKNKSKGSSSKKQGQNKKPAENQPEPGVPQKTNGQQEKSTKAGAQSQNKAKEQTVRPYIRQVIPIDSLIEEPEEFYEEAPVKQKIEVKVHTGSGVPENSIFNRNALKTKKDRKREEKYGKPVPAGEEAEGVETAFTAEELDAEYELWKQDNENGTKKEFKEKHGFFEKLIGKK